MKRALLLLLLAAGSLGGGAVHASALTVATVSCEHLHLTYQSQFTAADTPYAVTVGPSECGAATAVTGGGTITFLTPEDNTTCDGSLEIVCSRISLSLSTGASPTFTTEGALDFPLVASPIPNGTLDYSTAEAITGFSAGTGSGVLNTVCTFSNPVESCAADGSLEWVP